MKSFLCVWCFVENGQFITTCSAAECRCMLLLHARIGGTGQVPGMNYAIKLGRRLFRPKRPPRPGNSIFCVFSSFWFPAGPKMVLPVLPRQTSKSQTAAAGRRTEPKVVMTKVAQSPFASDEPPLDPKLAIGIEVWLPRSVEGGGVRWANSNHHRRPRRDLNGSRPGSPVTHRVPAYHQELETIVYNLTYEIETQTQVGSPAHTPVRISHT